MLVSGLNLPMLIRIMNYRTLPINELRDIAIEGGKLGITSMQS
jgi:mannose/fructose-specific phosphotransferase system component IIA